MAKKQVSSILKRRSSYVFYYAMFALPVIQFCIFYIGVNINSILLAFKEYVAVGEGMELRFVYNWVGFANFKTFFENVVHDPLLITSIKNSLLIYGINLIVNVPLTLFFSYYIYKQMFASKIARFFLFLPSIIPSMAMVIIFMSFMENFLPGIGLPNFLYSPDTRLGAIIFFNIWIGFGMSILMYSGAMAQIDQSIIESANLDGASSFKEFWHIVLPMIFPTLSTFLVISVAGIFTNQASVYSFYSSNAVEQVYNLGYYLFLQVMGTNASLATYPYGSAAGIVMTVIAAPLTLLVKYLLEKFGPSTN